MEQEIVSLITERGPLTGSELMNATEGENIVLWRTCRLSEKLTVQRAATRYLRLDRRVKGFARLSPSILSSIETEIEPLSKRR